MHTLFEGTGYATATNKKQVDTYQIYPGGATVDKAEALDHIIVKVEYKVHTQVGHFNYKVYNKDQQKDVYAYTGIKDRGEQTLTCFITICKFLVTEDGTDNLLVSLNPDKIHRIDLNYPSLLSSTNTESGIRNTNETTGVTPRPEGTDECPRETVNTVPVSVVSWIHININTELD